MKLMVGLGNPGEKYKNNRHNVGYVFVDEIVTSNKGQATRSPYPELATCYVLHTTILVKPQTFMNDSGKAVAKLVSWYKISPDDLYVVHDDLDIPLGQYKIQKGVGPKVHNGVNSVNQALGTRDYWRIRIGVDNRDPSDRTPGDQYVLQDFTENELRIVNSVLGKIVEEIQIRNK